MKNRIIVEVNSEFLPHQSNLVKEYYLFSYNVIIRNKSKISAKLLSRYWSISDGLGNTEDIHGPGVVGKTPTIKPGETFEYTSFCPLKTPVGTMEGSFRMRDENKVEFDVEIKPFKLVASQVLN
jgi:ApaG protein